MADTDNTDLVETFNVLTKRWEDDTIFASSPTEISSHPAYQEIIALGEPVLPYIFADVKETGIFWFPALHAITGEDPAAGETTVLLAQEKWLNWGKQKGYHYLNETVIRSNPND